MKVVSANCNSEDNGIAQNVNNFLKGLFVFPKPKTLQEQEKVGKL